MQSLILTLFTVTIATTIVFVICAPTDAPESSEIERANSNTQDTTAPSAVMSAVVHNGDLNGASSSLHHTNHGPMGPVISSTNKQQNKRELDYEYFYKFRNVVGEGVKKALDECRQKFKWDRWNCPLKSFQSIMNQEEFPAGVMPSNKELGLTRALISSGIVLSIVRSCSVGTNSLCSCGTPMKMSLQNAEIFLANGAVPPPQTSPINPQSLEVDPEQTAGQPFRSTNQIRTSVATGPAAGESNYNVHENPEEIETAEQHNSFIRHPSDSEDQALAIQETSLPSTMHVPITNQRGNRFAWAGCDEVIKLGFKVAKAYLTPPDRTPGSDATHLIDAHNYEAGRQAVKLTMRRHCKCHGTSGACQLNTCWTVPPDMSEVGEYLKRQYRVAAKVGAVTAKETDVTSLAKELSSIRSEKLVFADASPDYCYENKQLGINGTLGRYCSRKRHRPDGSEVSRSERDSCDRLCTKCGYKIKREKISVERQCDCRFVYCCSIECKRCPHVEETYKCVRHS